MNIDTKHSVIINMICCVLVSAWVSALKPWTSRVLVFSFYTIVNTLCIRRENVTQGMCPLVVKGTKAQKLAYLFMVFFDPRWYIFSSVTSILLNLIHRPNIKRAELRYYLFFRLIFVLVIKFLNSRKSHRAWCLITWYLTATLHVDRYFPFYQEAILL